MLVIARSSFDVHSSVITSGFPDDAINRSLFCIGTLYRKSGFAQRRYRGPGRMRLPAKRLLDLAYRGTGLTAKQFGQLFLPRGPRLSGFCFRGFGLCADSVVISLHSLAQANPSSRTEWSRAIPGDVS